jgi:hypothetical protein
VSGEEKEDDSLAIRVCDEIRVGQKLEIAAIMKMAGVTSRTAAFNLQLHEGCERFRKKTGHHAKEDGGFIVVQDRGKQQLDTGIRMARAAQRKNARSADVIRGVRKDNLDPVDQRRRDRKLDRLDANNADVEFKIIEMVRDASTPGVEEYRVRREKRPRSQ